MRVLTIAYWSGSYTTPIEPSASPLVPLSEATSDIVIVHGSVGLPGLWFRTGGTKASLVGLSIIVALAIQREQIYLISRPHPRQTHPDLSFSPPVFPIPGSDHVFVFVSRGRLKSWRGRAWLSCRPVRLDRRPAFPLSEGQDPTRSRSKRIGPLSGRPWYVWPAQGPANVQRH